MSKPLPANTLDLYRAVRDELTEIVTDIKVLIDLPDTGLSASPLKNVVKRIEGRTFKFIDEELGYVDPADMLPSDEVAIYKDSEPYVSGRPYNTSALYERWVAIYKFLLRRIGEYKRSSLEEDELDKLVHTYGIHLVGTHEDVVRSGLSKT